MIQNDTTNGQSLKAIKAKESQEQEAQLRAKCEQLAKEKYGEEQVVKWSNANKGLFFLPILDSEDAIEKLAILKPINRNILSYASTKLADEGLYSFLEVILKELWIEGDREIIDEDEYFIPAANKLNKILDSKKAALLKR